MNANTQETAPSGRSGLAKSWRRSGLTPDLSHGAPSLQSVVRELHAP
jgi:hypothetical protein